MYSTEPSLDALMALTVPLALGAQSRSSPVVMS